MSKNKKKKNKYLHIVDDNLNNEKEIKDLFVNANTPLSAAKKIWRVNKDLDIIWIKDVNTNDIPRAKHITVWRNYVFRGSV